jgi:hypothetical protein
MKNTVGEYDESNKNERSMEGSEPSEAKDKVMRSQLTGKDSAAITPETWSGGQLR